MQPIDLTADRPGSLLFAGSRESELFTREVAESLAGVIEHSMVKVDGVLPAGFLHASAPGQICHGESWTRDAGTFLRELIAFGYWEHAKLAAAALIRQVTRNEAGFFAFPERFMAGGHTSGRELDGTCAIIISLVMLWQRLPVDDPMRGTVREFLRQDGSPVRFLVAELASKPLIAGSGEFGPGCTLPGTACSAVQNQLAALALGAAAEMEAADGAAALATELRGHAQRIRDGMIRHLGAPDGGWLWCVDPQTLQPVPEVLDHVFNKGFGGINGVACMYSDVLGFEPLLDPWPGIVRCQRTFDRLWSSPERQALFARFGLWQQFDGRPTQFLQKGVWGCEIDLPPEAHLSAPSYGHGYALQTMLLHDRLDLADRALRGLALATYDKQQRRSPYLFYERMIMTDQGVLNGTGCGELNLVNVAEPLKVARLLLGVDDTRRDEVRLIPRLPASIERITATAWPIRTSAGVSRADIVCRRDGAGTAVDIRVVSGPALPRLRVRTGASRWQDATAVATATFSAG